MERELLLTGIGGQGIQLAAQVLARAAIAEGREVQMFGSYGGMMRGGNTEATVVIADGPIEAPPTVGETWSAILMHHDFSEGTIARLRPGSLVLVNSTVFEGSFDVTVLVVDVPATDIAVELGNIMTASMVMLGAYSAITGLVGLAALDGAVEASLPSYRTQHVARTSRRSAAGSTRCPRAGRRVERGGGMTAETVLTRGTVVIDVEACKGCDLCIDACPPRVLEMTTHDVNSRGYRYPLLQAGCTGCQACAWICPDFCFQVYKYDTPLELDGAGKRVTALTSDRTRTGQLLEGSEAIADAMIAAGCRFFAGYPMTPFTEILEHMAAKLPDVGGVCMNAESELEAVGMAWGAAATGTRAATGSTGQGLSLMLESISESGTRRSRSS